MTSIERSFQAQFARSAELYTQAESCFPGGVTHDARYALPFPLYINQSSGAYKWDVDDNRMIDYWSGHGALLLGHAHPAVVAAVQAQTARGTHYGAGHELEIRWAQSVQQLMPGAERVRFTSSGTEATMLALRLARAFTRRPAIIRFAGHFHGWHDMIAPGADIDDPHAGLNPALIAQMVVLDPDLDQVAQTLATRDDIAAVILEPTGAAYGTAPLPEGFLTGLRALTAERDVLLICDEVVTGFRVSPGGVQRATGVTADLTCMAKILAGGLPGGAVAGRAAILQHLAFGDAGWNNNQKIRHQGTYNANPLSAAAGCAALELVASGEPGATASARCTQLIAGLNDLFRRRELAGWAAYGHASIFHIFASNTDTPPGALPPAAALRELKRGGDPQLLKPLRMALLTAGVDLMRGRSGFVSAAHSVADIETTVTAFDTAISAMQADGILARA